MDLEKNTVFNF